MTRNFWKFFGQAVGSITSIISMHAFFTSTSWNEILRLFGISAIGIFGLFMLSGFIIDSCKFANERYKKKQKEREREERANEILETLPYTALILLKNTAETRFVELERNLPSAETTWISCGGSQPFICSAIEAESNIDALFVHRLIYPIQHKPTTAQTVIVRYHITGFGLFCSTFLDDYLDLPETDEQPQEEPSNPNNPK